MAEPIASATVEVRADFSKLDNDAQAGMSQLEKSLGKANALWADIMSDAAKAGEGIEDSFAEAARSSDASLEKIGGTEVWGDVTRGADKAGEGVEDAMKEASKESEKQLDKIGTSGDGMFKKLAGAAAGIGIGFFLKDSVQAADDSKAGFKELQSIIEATGSAAGLTADQVAGIAGDLSVKIGVDDDDIIKAQGVLLTFKNIGGDSFKRVTEDAADMAAVFGGDMSSASVQLGKALNDPVAGVSALSKVGVTFTAQQKDQIKAMVEAGDTAGAQGIILKELESQVKGAAEASATGSDKMKVAFGELQESLGGGIADALGSIAPTIVTLFDSLQAPMAALGDALGDILPVLAEAIGPILAGVTELLPVLAEGFTGTLDALKPLIPILVDGLVFALNAIAPILPEIVVGLIAYKAATAASSAVTSTMATATKLFGSESIIVQAATKAWTALQWLFNAAMAANPIVLVVAAVVALGAAIFLAYQKFGPFHEAVDAAWQLMQKVWDFIVNVFVGAWHGLQDVIDTIAGVFGDFGGKVAEAWDSVVGFISDLPGKILGFITDVVTMFINLHIQVGEALLGLIATVGEKIATMALQALEAVGKFILAFLEWYVTLPFKVGMALASLAGTVATAIGDAAISGLTAVGGFVGDALQKLGDFERGIPGKLLNLGVTIGNAITTGLADGLHAVEGFVTDALSAVGKFIIGIPHALGDIGGAMFGAIKSALEGVWNRIVDSLPNFHADPLGIFGPEINFDFDFLKLARGGIVTSPTFAMLGERSRPEVAIPMTNPGRAMQLMQDSGMGALWDRMGGGSGGWSGDALHIDHATFQDATDADLVAQRVNVAVMTRMVSV